VRGFPVPVVPVPVVHIDVRLWNVGGHFFVG
jgi:hypothetical protein